MTRSRSDFFDPARRAERRMAAPFERQATQRERKSARRLLWHLWVATLLNEKRRWAFAVKVGRCSMRPEDAPPGFWQGPSDQAVLVDGVELESSVPTRFFQTADTYPSQWGRLSWRIQLNKIVAGRAVLPVFRTFYPGVEWNLNHPDYRWFLSAWFRWEGPGPQYRDPCFPPSPQIEDDTALFRLAWMTKPGSLEFPDSPSEPDLDRPIFLRSRVDARDRRRISEVLRSQHEPQAASDSAVILLDDIIDSS
jgi:hypothetical protein